MVARAAEGQAGGAHPVAGLTLGRDGNFYGTTKEGGAYGNGAVFQMTPMGTVTILYSFNGLDGDAPESSLVLGPDGNFYGTTYAGGKYGVDTMYRYGAGMVFKISSSGSLITLHSFDGKDGALLYAGLALGLDGNFYGTTYAGGKYGFGTVFKISPSGSLTTLHSFSARSRRIGGNTDGSSPVAGLTLGPDGNFYGTACAGGKYDAGTVFKISPSGSLTTLHAFRALSGPRDENTDGGNPKGSLTLGRDGNFYGTTYAGGKYGVGTVFKIRRSGKLTTLHSFDVKYEAGPFGLTLAQDGNFYGTTALGNEDAQGTVFRLTPGGKLTILHRLHGSEGEEPASSLALGPDGIFYGTTAEGGENGHGTIFKITQAGNLTTLHAF
jgi:uncharacterized repeat protein (TIGR03803 family)